MANKSRITRATEKELDRFDKNFAADDEVSSRFLDYVTPIIKNTRENRRGLEEKWVEDIRDWSCVLDSEGYRGRSNVFIPEINAQIESSVEKALGSVFAGPDFIHAVPLRGTNEETSNKIKAAVVYELEQRNQLFLKQDEHQRQKILCGTSVFKGGFKKEMLTIYTRDKKGKPIKTDIPKWNGTTWDVLDIFRWYIFPETSDIKSAQVIFEDQMIDLDEAKDSGLYLHLDDLKEEDFDKEHMWADSEKLEIATLSQAIKSRPGCVLFTEVWTTFELRKGKKVPVMGVIANNGKVVRLIRNPFWFQAPPYAGSRYLRRPGKIYYGLSLPDKIRTQGKMMSDIMNQTMDSLNYALSPITIIDPALAGDVNSFKTYPGAKWLGSPEGIRVENFPDVSPSGLRALQEVRGQIAQFSDNTPGIAPQLQGKARSATQASFVQGSVSLRQKVQSLGEETEVLSPICYMTHILLQQFMEEEWQIRLQGPDQGSWITMAVTPADLVGEIDWVWKGSSEEEKTAVRSQQLLAFYNAALQTASILPPGELDVAALFRRVAKEAFNLQDMDQIFKSLRDKKTVDPELENIGLLDFQDVDINTGDDDAAHIDKHREALTDKGVSPEQKLNVLRHIEKHNLQAKAKIAIEKNKARLQAIQMAQQQAPGGAGSDGRATPQPPGIGEGNPGQVANTPQDVMSGVKGV